jgi:hypothetical protein
MRDLGSRGAELLAQSQSPPVILCDVLFVWFDGEEALLPEWNDGLLKHPARIQDNTYGSRHFASLLKPCTYQTSKAMCLPAELGSLPLVSLTVLDMIGSPRIKLAKDTLSSPWMVDHLSKIVKKLNFNAILETIPKAIEDDHVPFVKKGISALDIIDFSNLTYWHTHGDDASKISYQSIEKAAKIGLSLSLDIAASPKEFLKLAEESIGNL